MLTNEEREAVNIVKAAARKYLRDDPEDPSFRNHAASIVLQGLVSNQDFLNAAGKVAKSENGSVVQLVVQAAVEYTDALINELKKEK